jgi:hypothetical protein
MCTAQVVRRVRQVALVEEAAVAVAVVAVREWEEGLEVRREKPQLQARLRLKLVEVEQAERALLAGQAETALSLPTRLDLGVEQVAVVVVVVQAAREFGEAAGAVVELESPQG